MYKDHNNFDVEGDAQCVVNMATLFHDEKLWTAAHDDGKVITVNGHYYWLTTVEMAVKLGYVCHVWDGQILNSTISPI